MAKGYLCPVVGVVGAQMWLEPKWHQIDAVSISIVIDHDGDVIDRDGDAKDVTRIRHVCIMSLMA